MPRKIAIFLGALGFGVLLLLFGLLASLPGSGPAAAYAATALAPLAAADNPTGFTYQGSLNDTNGPADGTFGLAFHLYDAASAGLQVGSGVTTTTPVSNGLFTVNLDFGANAFDGSARYLEIAVQPSGTGAFTTLAPRQPITPSPWALFALKTQGYGNVVIVAKSGGDFSSIQAAINSIGDASASNRYLVWVAPGVYYEQVTMAPYIDIEGAGQASTVITQPGAYTEETGTVIGASNAELRSLTVRATGAGQDDAVGIFNFRVAPTLRDLTVVASDANNFNYGVYNYNGGAIRMENVTISASGGKNYNYGVLNEVSSTTMTNVTVSVSGGAWGIGVANDAGSPTMTNVLISVSSVYLAGIGVTNYDNSPTMTNVTISAAGGSATTGVENERSSPKMNNVIVSASGGTASNTGVSNSGGSAPTIDNSVISGGSGYGVSNSDSGTNPSINNSQISGAANTIYNDNSAINMRIGASQLAGGDVHVGSGSITCYSVYDENFTNSGGINACP